MPAQANLKSAAITSLDATPPVRTSAGKEGAGSYIYDVVGKVGPTTDGATTGGILRVVRFPSNIILRKLEIVQQAVTTTASFDIGLYYSDANDGTPVLSQGLILGSGSDAMFASGLDTHALVTWTDTTFGVLAKYAPADTVNPIWKAAGTTLTADPGGYFDLCLTNKATISGAATLIVRVQYVWTGV